MLSINGQSISLEDACLVGIKYYQNNEINEAVNVFCQVIAVDPLQPRALNALAVIESEKNNYDQAEAWLDKLLTAHPDFEKGYNTRGMLRLKMKKVDDAEKDFHDAILLNPNFAEAYGNLGDIHLLRRNYVSAADCFRRVISLNPVVPHAFCGLGKALAMQGLFAEALINLGMAFDIAPDFAPAHLAKGDCLRMLGRFTEAVAAYESALLYKPDAAIYHRCLGIAYNDIKNMSRAQVCLLDAQRLDPTDPITELYLGSIYAEMGYLRDAEQAYLRGLQLATFPEDIAMQIMGLGNAYMSMGQSDKAIGVYRSGLETDPGNALLHSNLLMAMNYSAEVTAAEIVNESVAWGENHSVHPVSGSQQVGDLPLKIGFLSADFKEHSASYFFEPLLAQLDRHRFKVYCYSGVRKPDVTTERLKALTDCWVDCFSIPDDLLAEKIIAEKIDVLVDLSGHTNGNRLGVFARRASPVQITWLGYPGTTGVQAIGYRISDSIADPVGVTDKLHTEKLVRLQDCFLCYQPPPDTPQVSPLPVLEKRHVTFGSFNNLAKVTPQVLAAWGKILVEVPDSRMILKCWSFVDDDILSHWQNQMEAQGVERARVSLIPFESGIWNHFARYGEIDIALDTFPYNGTTTTCEALWMGVPVITLSGDHHASRVGASLLSCIGLSELVTENWNAYVAKAIMLASDLEKLQSFRQTMRDRLRASPLCDAAGFAVRWENAVLDICQGLVAEEPKD